MALLHEMCGDPDPRARRTELANAQRLSDHQQESKVCTHYIAPVGSASAPTVLND